MSKYICLVYNNTNVEKSIILIIYSVLIVKCSRQSSHSLLCLKISLSTSQGDHSWLISVQHLIKETCEYPYQHENFHCAIQQYHTVQFGLFLLDGVGTYFSIRLYIDIFCHIVTPKHGSLRSVSWQSDLYSANKTASTFWSCSFVGTWSTIWQLKATAITWNKGTLVYHK